MSDRASKEALHQSKELLQKVDQFAATLDKEERAIFRSLLVEGDAPALSAETRAQLKDMLRDRVRRCW
jgi:hypothetical protein